MNERNWLIGRGIHGATLSSAAMCVAVALSAPRARGQTATWTEVQPGPGTRHEFAMAFDSARGRTVVFGGTKDGTTAGDTWEWDGTDWVEQHPAMSPSARIHHAMAYDSARGRIVLYGGWNYPGSSVLDDTWEYDGVNWQQREVQGPGPRLGHAMAYDSIRQRTVLYGAQKTLNNIDTTGDTWEWDGDSWTQVCADCPPPSRALHSMVFDSVRGRVVLFGGWDATLTNLADTWEYDGTGWIERTPLVQGPSARRAHSMAFHEGLARVVLLGGSNANWDSSVSGTWEWDGVNWTLEPEGPSARWEHAMAYDTGRCAIVLYGGQGTHGEDLSDTWEYGLPNNDDDEDGTPDCRDGCPNDPNKTEPGLCDCGMADAIEFVGFLPPIGGSDATGGSFGDPVRTFKLGSTIPVKFIASQCDEPLLIGVHTLRAIKYSSAVDSDPPIDATPTDAATSGNEFRLADGEWHFNLSTRTGFSQGTWKLIATLSDGSTHYVWITIKR
jgi:hypothetical protein